MKNFKNILLSVCSVLTFFSVANANATYSELSSLEIGASRMIALGNRCEYRMSLRSSVVSSQGTMFDQTYLNYNARTQWIAKAPGQSTDQFKFDITREQRFALVPFIPASGQFQLGSLNYGASSNQAVYSAYISESDEKNYNCSISISPITQAQIRAGVRVVPNLVCSRRNSDVVQTLVFVVNPTNIRLQEDC